VTNLCLEELFPILRSSIRLVPVVEKRREIDTEFSGLLATSVENAEVRDALQHLAEEHAALRRVAILVAERPESEDLFSAVAREVAYVLDVRGVIVDRFEGDGSQVTVGSAYDPELASAETYLGVGARMPLQPGKLAAAVQATRRTARVDDYSKLDANTGAAARASGIGSGCAAPIFVDGDIWGQICVFSASGTVLPADTESRLEDFVKLIGTAIANAKHQSELEASRRRIVAASDAARRRIERDLHDGVQQQLVSLGLHIATLEADVPEGDRLNGQLADLRARLGSVLDALMEIARGIHPAILGHGGLAPALRGLSRRSSVPVALDARIDVELPEEVEVAAYYVVSETLTNVAKHARASRVHIDVRTDDRGLTLMVRDDGIGGAALGDGSGLTGLQDRVEALGGTMMVESPPGRGTSIGIVLPTEREPSSPFEHSSV
jgi:signal transduction histidine kinase